MSTQSTRASSGGASTITAFIPIAAIAMIVALWAALIYAPTERVEGDMQRMFYLHVPAAFTMFLAYGIMTLASVIYLVRREDRWDEAAAACAGVATLFATIVLLTGPVWAKPVWGTWWTWDARLTSTLVLWLILVAYQMLREYGGSPEQVARYCAVLAVIGFADLPIIHYSVKWWRTLHPDPKIMTEGSVGQGLPPEMLLTFAIGMVATLMFFGVVLGLRLQLERQERRVAGLREMLRG